MPNIEQLERTARFLVAAGKGILAADESTRTMTKRLEANGLESTAESRRRYREMLLLAPGLEEHISGVILSDETFGQAASDGRPFPPCSPSARSCRGSRSTPAPRRWRARRARR